MEYRKEFSPIPKFREIQTLAPLSYPAKICGRILVASFNIHRIKVIRSFLINMQIDRTTTAEVVGTLERLKT